MNDPGVANDYAPLRTNMELTLPRDMFSPFRYFFVIRARLTFWFFLLLAIMTIGSIWFKRNKYRRRFAAALFQGFIYLIILGLLFLSLVAVNADERLRKGMLRDTRNFVSFLGEVVKSRPGLDENKWDLIAARSNGVFHHNNPQITPYFFYDGASCHSFFKSCYVSQATSTITSFHRFESENLIWPMIDEAVEVYKESLEEYWRQVTA